MRECLGGPSPFFSGFSLRDRSDEGLVLSKTFKQRTPNPTLEGSKLWHVRLLGSDGEVVVVATLYLPQEMVLESCQQGCGSFSVWLGGTATYKVLKASELQY